MNPFIFGDQADHRELASTLFPADTIRSGLEATAAMLRSEQVAGHWADANALLRNPIASGNKDSR